MMMVMVTMGRHDEDARRDMVMMVVMMVMAHHNSDLGELDLIGGLVCKPCVIGL